MQPRTQPLRDEHRALLPELAMLRIAADAIGTPAAADHVARSHRLLVRHLLPHIAAEEAVLYPAIDRLAGHDLTATLRRDHDEIRRRTAQIEAAPHHTAARRDSELRSALYGLDAIVRLHLTSEEELYYPLLDEHLDEAAAVTIVAAMQRVKHDSYQATALDARDENATTPRVDPA